MAGTLVEQVSSNSALNYIKESAIAKNGKRMLGRLRGICADLDHPTRNGRRYSKALWEKVLNSDTFKEHMENGCLFGELGHPADRLETDPEKIAVALSDIEMNEQDGTLIGTFDILDTPNGNILKALVDYGTTVGVSSRGGGDIETIGGEEYVAEDSYDFEAFDIVLLPAVKAARLQVVESLQGKTLKQHLAESLDKANPEDKKIMEETLKDLDLLDNEQESKPVEPEDDNKEMAAESDGASLIKDLQESMLAQSKLEEENAVLREKVSAGSTREAKLKEELEKVKTTVRTLSVKAQKNGIADKSLQEDLDKANKTIDQLNSKITVLETKLKESRDNKKTLIENKERANNALNESKQSIQLLEQALKNERSNNTKEIDKLNAVVESLKKDANIKINRANKRLKESAQYINNIKGQLKESLDAYIKMNCRQKGLDYQEVINKLPESYNTNDIDLIVEKLSDFKIRIGSLPFATTKIQGSVKSEPIQENKRKSDPDKGCSPELFEMLKTYNK